MDLDEAEALARKLITEYVPGTGFGWHSRKTAYGTCSGNDTTKKYTIKLSRPLITLCDQATVEKVIRHEIAHVRAGVKAKHGPVWRAHARAVGAEPRACTSGPVLPPKWVGTCPNCGIEAKRHRLTTKIRLTACTRCCNRYSRGRFDIRFMFVWTEVR